MFSPTPRKWARSALLGSVLLGLGASAAHAQQAPASQSAEQQALADLKSRLDRLEQNNLQLSQQNQNLSQQNQRLVELLQQQRPVQPAGLRGGAPNEDTRRVVLGVLKEQEDKKKAEEDKKKKEDAEKGYEVGSILTGAVRWDPSIAGFRYETPNKDFTAHIGGRFQQDWVLWSQDPALNAANQVGNLQDGTFFRRLRINLDGTYQDIFEYNFEYLLESIQQSEGGLDEMWVGITKLPFLGSIRVGHLKVPQGLEGDMVSSSKAMTFMERAAYTDAFYQNFAPGIWTGNSVMDQHFTWAGMFYRTERGSNGSDFGDGEYAASGRITWLPVYESDGRCLVHLGASTTWRAAEKPGRELTGARTINLQARPELRDAQGDFASTVLPGNATRMVSTGGMVSENVFVNGTEFLAINGPLSFQAEWAFATVDNVVAGGTTEDRHFHGGYAQISYFLTGEHRLYDRRLGRLGSLYTNPVTNFWAVRDEDEGYNFGRGAWEAAVRWSYLNLNDGPIQGGVLEGWTAGLNWYLNTNCKVQFEYVHDMRWHRNGASPPGNISGEVSGFGIRTQIFF